MPHLNMAYKGNIFVRPDGKVDGDAVYAFTNGHCHSFAYAMHELTGWPIFGMGGPQKSDPLDAGHVVVQEPKTGTFVDIEGPGVEDRWPMWDNLGEIKPKEILDGKMIDYIKPVPHVALPFAKTVLEKMGYKAPAVQTDLFEHHLEDVSEWTDY